MKWNAKSIRYKKEDRIVVFFEKDAQSNDLIKKIAGARWSRTLGAWHLPDTDNNRQQFEVPLKGNYNLRMPVKRKAKRKNSTKDC